MAGYIGTKAVALSTTTGNILGDMTVGGTTDLGTLEFNSLSGTGSVTITDILDEDNLASNSATKLATQQSIKAYVDAQVDTVDTLAEILAVGNRTSGAGKIEFRDAAIFINSSTDGQLDLVADTEIQLAATTVDLNGNLDVSGSLTIPSDIIHAGDSDTLLQFNASDSFRVITGNEERFKVSNGEVIVNDNSADMDFRVESNGNANMLFVDGGNNAVVVGANDADTTISGGTPAFQVIGTGVAASVASTRRENNAFGAALIMSKSRNTTPDAFTVVQAGDTLGSIIFIGDDGTNLDTYGATISNVVKSGVGENDMPTELIFSTNSGTTTVAERMKIQHNSGNNVVIADGLTLTDGNLIIGGAGHGIDFSATGQGAGSPSSEILSDYEEGTFTPELRDAIAGTAAGKAASSGRYTRVGRIVNISFAISVNSVSGMTGTNSLNVTGLPYTVNNDSAGGGEPHAQILSFISPLTSVDYGGSIILRPNNQTAACELKYTSGGANTSQGAQSLQVQNLGSNPYLCGSATYEVLAGT